MTTIEKQNDLQARKSALKQNGAKNAAGKLLARERIAKIFDEGSFVEIGALLGNSGEGVVTGHGTIDGRLAYAYAQDFTVMEGALSRLHAEKICNTMDASLKTGAPVIGIFDSDGARIADGVEVLSGYGKIFRKSAECSGVIPQISVVVGPCAGGAAFSPAMHRLSFMHMQVQPFRKSMWLSEKLTAMLTMLCAARKQAQMLFSPGRQPKLRLWALTVQPELCITKK